MRRGPHPGPAAAQIDKCFGFDTAVEESQRALLAAKVEAASALKGIGVVKLMGRQSGFIAMQASMASGAPHRAACCWVIPCLARHHERPCEQLQTCRENCASVCTAFSSVCRAESAGSGSRQAWWTRA